MGTCVGKRNLKYFLSFLLLTSLHAIITAIICAVYFFQVTNKIEYMDDGRGMERVLGLLSAGVGIYAALIGFTLFVFALYSINLAFRNITSNENLRTRWNAKHEKVKNQRRKLLAAKANEQMTPDELE